MGIIRKTISISTIGLVDFQSDKERVARSARLTKRAVKGQTRQMKSLAEQQADLTRQQIALQQQALYQQPGINPGMFSAPPSTGPGIAPAWLACPTDAPGILRWWDGARWTEHTHTS